jgi:hypothetical protein
LQMMHFLRNRLILVRMVLSSQCAVHSNDRNALGVKFGLD